MSTDTQFAVRLSGMTYRVQGCMAGGLECRAAWRGKALRAGEPL